MKSGANLYYLIRNSCQNVSNNPDLGHNHNIDISLYIKRNQGTRKPSDIPKIMKFIADSESRYESLHQLFNYLVIQCQLTAFFVQVKNLSNLANYISTYPWSIW